MVAIGDLHLVERQGHRIKNIIIQNGRAFLANQKSNVSKNTNAIQHRERKTKQTKNIEMLH